MKIVERLRRKFRTQNSEGGDQITSQSQNDRLMRLPVEVRLQIWRELIGGKLCHMVVTRTYSLRCYPCREFIKDEWGVAQLRPYTRDGLSTRCQGGVGSEACYVSYLQKVPFNTLSLLLTSRAINSEAIGILYSDNVFHVDNLQTLHAIVREIGPRMKMIKTVHIDLNVWQIRLKKVDSVYDSAYNSWIKKWDLFAREFSGLQHLRLDIWGCAPYRDFAASDLEEPLLKLQGLKSFRLAIWHHRSDAEGQELLNSGPMERYFQDRICG
ncbi:MAG: hypothetical protein Q9215_004889 [Flavoplaca cf. flavocitrina]